MLVQRLDVPAKITGFAAAGITVFFPSNQRVRRLLELTCVGVCVLDGGIV
jgi:hypothetical protein